MVRWLWVLVAAVALHAQTLADADRLRTDGRAAWDQGDLDAAETAWRQALAILEPLAPGSADVARVLADLGSVARRRGDLAGVADCFGRALAVWEVAAPESLDVAACLKELAGVAWARGDLEAALTQMRRALAIEERLEPDSLRLAASLNNIGAIAQRRGDMDSAVEYHTRALAIRERLAPDSLLVAGSLNNLGGIAWARDQHEAALDYYTRSVAIKERLAPDSLDLAMSLDNLGVLSRVRADLGAAKGYYQRAGELFERLAPGSLALAGNLHNRGYVAQLGGDLAAARDYFERSIELRERLAPGSLDLAQGLHMLAGVAGAMGDAPAALAFARRAVDHLEQQRLAAAGSETRSLLAAANASAYRRLVDACLAAGLADEAYTGLERCRARGLVDSLAERHLDFAADAPAELRGRQEQLDAQTAALHRELARLNPRDDSARIDELGVASRSLSVRQRELEAEIRRASPRYAALRYPEPLDAAGVRAALDKGTLLLAFQVDEAESHLFAVTRESLDHFRLGWGEAELQTRIAEFARLCSRPGSTPERSGRSLYEALLQPAQARIDAAERLLICAEGPLLNLPFAALVTSPEGQPVRYLVEDRPLHGVHSATLYRQLREAGRPPRPQPQLLALGAPGLEAAPAATQIAALRGLPPDAADQLGPLPHARAEVEGIGGLFGERATVRVGPAATEALLKAGPIDADVLHFACHGIYFEGRPLESALLLQPGDGEDGLLQVWEVFEQLRLNADLVVLSACQTGLGRVLKFEGLMGLTRAFQYAGARSVIVSQWRVSDESTVDLMTELHRRRAAGRSKDQSLREAQLSLIRSDRRIAGQPVSHPFFWAAFALVGDYR